MKISQLVEVLNDLKKEYGDKYIWSMDGLDSPCPRNIDVELTSILKRTDYGFSGGKKNQNKDIEITLEYEDGVDVVDRSFWDK